MVVGLLAVHTSAILYAGHPARVEFVGGGTRGGEVCGCRHDLVNRHLLLLLEPQVLSVDLRLRLKAVSSAKSKYLMTSGV